MADISKILEAAAWHEFEAEGEEAFGKFKLKIKVFDPLESVDFLAAVNDYRKIDVDRPEEALKRSNEFIGRILDLVLDWDFTDGDRPIPCTPETKRKHLLGLLKLKLKDGDLLVMYAISRLAQNVDAALKN